MGRKLKIGILIDQLVAGGVQKTAILEAIYLQKLGYQTKLLILMRAGLDKNILSLTKGVDVEFLSDRYPKQFSKSIKLPIFHFLTTLHILSPFLTPLKLNASEFDILISHGTTTTFTARLLKATRAIPYIFVIHDPMKFILNKIYADTPLKPFFLPLSIFLKAIEKSLLKNSASNILDSPAHSSFIKKEYGLSPQVIYLSQDMHQKPIELGDKILTFGRWDKKKGLETLLDIVKTIPHSGLIVAGSWTNQEDLRHFKKLVQLANLAGRVDIIPKYTEKGLATLCRQARLWVSPNFEAFSLSALEAASFGLPIIIPAKSGVTNLFEDKTHGFFPKSDSYTDIKKAIEILLKDKTMAQKMGLQAKIQAREISHPLSRARDLAQIAESECTPKMAAIEAAHIGNKGIAGGDLLLGNMLKFTKQNLPFTIIVSEQNSKHWARRDFKIIRIKKTFFERHTDPLFIFFTYLSRILATYKILRNSRWDLLYSSTDIITDIFPAYLKKVTSPKTKWIARIHHISQNPTIRPGNYLVNLFSTTLQKISLAQIKSKADMIVVLNRQLKDRLEKDGFDKKKIEILGGGVDFQYFSNFKSIGKQRFDAVYLGRIHRAKGVFDLPEIWLKVQKLKPGSKLAIIGPGDEEIKAKLDKKFVQFNLKNHVKIFGYLKKNKVISILKSSKVFVFCDHEAGFGLAPLEAMAAGLPIVGFDIGILGNIFKSGYLTVPAFDKNLFAQKITLLLKNDKLRNDLGQNAQVEASKFDWTKISSKFERILFTMLQ